MKSFLRFCKDAVNDNTNNPFYICIGNQASDLDSIISSIVFSYAQYKNDNVLVVPIINIPEDEYNLRADVTWLLGRFGINSNDLIFYHQNQSLMYILERSAKSNSLRVILTDHNKLTPEQETLLGNSVYQIIDHHVDEKCYNNIDPEKRIIDLIGSSCTIISELLNDEFLNNNKDCCEALLGVILLDTMNLDPKFKKVTPRDEKQAFRLSYALQINQKEKNLLFETLFNERFNVSNFTSYELLVSDYKEWKMGGVFVGIAAAKRSLTTWFDKDPTLEHEIKKFYESKQLDILYVMCSYNNENQFNRELVIFAPNQNLLNDSINHLMECPELNLIELNNHKTQYSCETKYFIQQNVTSSRKVLQPILFNYYCKMNAHPTKHLDK